MRVSGRIEYMKKTRNLKHIFAITLISLTLIFGSIMLFSLEFSNAINWFFVYRTTGGVWQDHIYQHHLTPSSDIAIIAIDEHTINTLQATGDQKMLTIPKSTYSELVEKLEWAGVKGIAFDIVFQNSDENDKKFAKVLEQYNNIIIGTSVYWYTGTGGCILDQTNGLTTCEWFPRSIYREIPWWSIDTGKLISEKTGEVQWARKSGEWNQAEYERSVKIDIHTKNPSKWIDSIPGSWKYTSIHGPATEIYSLPIGLAKLTDEKSTRNMLLMQPNILNPFFWPPDSYHGTSMIDVLGMDTATLTQSFSGKYIFIGEVGTFIHDSLVSPVTGTMMNGVELHAHFLDGLLQNKMLSGLETKYLWISIATLTLVTVILYLLLPSYLSPIVAIVMMGWVLWISRYLYDIERTLVDIFPLFLAGGFLTFPITFIYRFFVVDRERRYIENAFGHYIDPKMVKMIDMEEVSLTLGGEEREVTVFFSDIAGFTTISEALGTRDLFYLMSSYLSRMTDILIREGGTLDKYIGDAVMGFFGAPVTQSDHAKRACRTALEMRKILPGFNQEIVERGMKPIEFRVGIATGDVMVGNIGSSDHFNYTVLGDTVNLASRLEAMGKEYGVHIIISGGTLAQVGDMFAVRELDTIAVKWKTEGVKIYELLGLLGYTTDSAMYETYAQALSLYQTGSYMEARKLWETQVAIDPPSRVMALRCTEILEGRVHIEDGVYHMTHK
jgi:class 3 adenylate cyclase